MTERKHDLNGLSSDRKPLYGHISAPVQVRFVGASAEDVQIQLDRMVILLGPFFMATAPRQGEDRRDWIAYGTITE